MEGMHFTNGAGCCAEVGGEQQGIQSRACPGAGVQLCLAILCTINLNKERASGTTLGLLMKCLHPRSGESLAALFPQGHRAVCELRDAGHQGLLIFQG